MSSLRGPQRKPACSQAPQGYEPKLIVGPRTRKSVLCSVTLEGIEGFVRVSNERQAHLRFLLVRHSASLSAVDGTGVFLRDFVDGEVRNIDIRAEPRLEWSANVAELLPNHPAEEGVVLDLCGTPVLTTIAANTVFRIAEETVHGLLASFSHV